MINIAKDTKAVCSIDDIGMAKRNQLQAWIDLYDRKFSATVGRQATKIAAQKNGRRIP